MSGDYLTSTSLDVKPDLVDPAIYGHHSSRLSKSGKFRVWTFRTVEGRDKFTEDLVKNPEQFKVRRQS